MKYSKVIGNKIIFVIPAVFIQLPYFRETDLVSRDRKCTVFIK